MRPFRRAPRTVSEGDVAESWLLVRGSAGPLAVPPPRAHPHPPHFSRTVLCFSKLQFSECWDRRLFDSNLRQLLSLRFTDKDGGAETRWL